MKPTESQEQGVDLETPLDFIFEIVAKPAPATDLNAYKLPYPEYIPIIRKRRIYVGGSLNQPLAMKPPEDVLWSLEHCTDASELPDYFRIDSDVWVASDRFKALVERFAVPNVDFYPLRLELKRPDQVDSYGGGAIIEQGYWIMDDYHHLDVVDTDRSEISWMEKYDKFEDAVRECSRRFPKMEPENFGKIGRLVLKTQGTPDHFFRMRYFTRMTFGSATFVKAIIDDGMNVLIRPFLLHPARELEIRSAAEKVRHEMARAGQPVMAVPPRRHYGTGALYPRGFYYSGKNIAADKGMSDVVIETVIGR